jgi:hypothetical protein
MLVYFRLTLIYSGKLENIFENLEFNDDKIFHLVYICKCTQCA